MSEFEFVQAMIGRRVTECLGQTVTLTLGKFILDDLDDVLFACHMGDLHSRLWDGYVDENHGRFTFTLCAGHWMVVAAYAGTVDRNRPADRPGDGILWMTIKAAGWDHKEVANLLSWHATR